MRETLLEVGARQFCARGISSVSVEDLLIEADISRATFYSIFSSKNNLLEFILNPLFDILVRKITPLVNLPAKKAFDSITEIYIDVWLTNRDGLLLISLEDIEACEQFSSKYTGLYEGLLSVLVNAEKENLLLNGSAHYSMRILVTTAIQLLKIYEDHPDGETLFRNTMRKLIFGRD
tara:strand:+ start:2027 stop:2557 length:531 start_codon:yes stop_codon:yes gene_type:complete